jgi:hypothetical protein
MLKASGRPFIKANAYCIYVEKCPTFGGLLTNYVGSMALNLSLDRGVSVSGRTLVDSRSHQFRWMHINLTLVTKGDLECISIHSKVTHMLG